MSMTGRESAWVLGATAAAVGLGLVAYALRVGASRYLESGDPFPGRTSAVLDVVGNYVGAVLAALVVGGLVIIAIATVIDSDGYIDVSVYRTHRLVRRLSALWMVWSTGMVLVAAADTAGLSVVRMVVTGQVEYAVSVSLPAIAWMVCAVAAGVVSVVTAMSLRWLTHVSMLLPAAIGVAALPAVGNAAQGPDHDYTTGVVVCFAVAFAVSLGVRCMQHSRAGGLCANSMNYAAAQRIKKVLCTADAVALVCVVAVAGLLRTRDVPGSAFGVATGVLIVSLVGLVIADVITLRVRRDTVVPAVAAGALVVAAGCWAVMDTRVAPGLIAHPFTVWDVYLGYPLPDPPAIWSMLGVWRFDIVVGGAAVAMGLAYGIAVRRLRRRGSGWPLGRAVSWFAGCVVLVLASSSGVRAYGNAMFSVHMVEHMGLSMIAPALLALGAPASLALRAFPRHAAGQQLPSARSTVLMILDSPTVRVLTHPVVALSLFVGVPFAVYFTPVFGILARYHWGHIVMSGLFVVVGYLFFWTVTGVDRGPRRLPILGRLGLLFAAMPFHAFFGIALMTMSTVVAESFYQQLQLPWQPDPAQDQWVGGVLAWVVSEVPIVVIMVVLVVRWARQERAGRRHDDYAVGAGGADSMGDIDTEIHELAAGRRLGGR